MKIQSFHRLLMLWDKEVDLKDIWDMARIYKMIVTLVGK